VYTNTTNITLNYKRIPHTEIAYTNYLTSSLDVFIGKTLVSNSGVPFTYLFINKKLYYNGSLFLNRSIGPTSTSL